MAELEFYSQNEGRAYPLQEGPSRIVGDARSLSLRGIVDAGFVMGLDAGFEVDQHSIYLHKFIVSATDLTFVFTSDAPGTNEYEFFFVVPLSSQYGSAFFVAARHKISLLENPDVGTAFLNIGSLRWYADFVAGTYLLESEVRVEPGVIQSLARGFARSVVPCNDPRPCPKTCHTPDEPEPPAGTSYRQAAGLAGVVALKEGHNCRIDVNTFDNSIQIAGSEGSGIGPACEDVRIDQNGFRRGDACVPCDGFIKSINGNPSNAGVFYMTGLQGVVVTDDPPGHRLVVTLEDNRVC